MDINTIPTKVVKMATIRRCITTLKNAGVVRNAQPFETFCILEIKVPIEAINTKRKRKPQNRKPITKK